MELGGDAGSRNGRKWLALATFQEIDKEGAGQTVWLGVVSAPEGGHGAKGGHSSRADGTQKVV